MALLPGRLLAQFDHLKDSVVDIYGVVMTADSLKALPGASVIIKGQNRGTTTNDQGLFHILASKGDIIRFSYVGFRTQEAVIPGNIPGNQYSVIETMTEDTQYLPVTIIQARPTRQQFERSFVNLKVDDAPKTIADRNTDRNTLKVLSSGLGADSREATNYHLSQSALNYSYAGQAPRQGLFLSLIHI